MLNRLGGRTLKDLRYDKDEEMYVWGSDGKGRMQRMYLKAIFPQFFGKEK